MSKNQDTGCGCLVSLIALLCFTVSGISAIQEGKTGIGITILSIVGISIFCVLVAGSKGNKANKQIKIIHSAVDDMSGEEYEKYCGEKIKTMNKVVKIQYTPITNDYGADIIAYSSDGTKAVIQCKRYKGKVNNTAVQEVVAALAHYNADKAIIMTNSTLTENARLLAKENGVKVIENFR